MIARPIVGADQQQQRQRQRQRQRRAGTKMRTIFDISRHVYCGTFIAREPERRVIDKRIRLLSRLIKFGSRNPIYRGGGGERMLERTIGRIRGKSGSTLSFAAAFLFFIGRLWTGARQFAKRTPTSLNLVGLFRFPRVTTVMGAR